MTGLTSWCLFDQIWVTALSVCFIFTVTIGTFPAVTADVKSAIAGEGEWSECDLLPALFRGHGKGELRIVSIEELNNTLFLN